jgi:hypothetical protein
MDNDVVRLLGVVVIIAVLFWAAKQGSLFPRD